MTREERIMKRLKEHYNYLIAAGYEIVCLMLQGSQNYELDEYSEDYVSNIDSKAIILPSFKDFVAEKTPISKTIILDNNEHIDIKDIRVMFEQFKKMNISYIELLYTKFKIINSKYEKLIQPLFNNKEIISAIDKNQFLKCLAGMSMEKVKALCHPYPNLIEKINKYGFDGKQLHHCVRLFEFISRYTKGESLEQCYISNSKEELKNLKKQLTFDGSKIMTKEEAIKIANFYNNQTKLLKDLHISKNNKINKEGYNILYNIKYNILKYKFKEDIAADDLS